MGQPPPGACLDERKKAQVSLQKAGLFLCGKVGTCVGNGSPQMLMSDEGWS